MQLTLANAQQTIADITAVYRGPKRDVSRAYRRLFDRIMPLGTLQLVFGDDNTTLTRTRMAQLSQLAQEAIQKLATEVAPYNDIQVLEPVVDKEACQIKVTLVFLDDPTNASLADYQGVARGVMEVVSELRLEQDETWTERTMAFADVLTHRRREEKVRRAIDAR